ncbi:MAG: tRNA wybutosine-synthesizing 3 family protein [archaeon]
MLQDIFSKRKKDIMSKKDKSHAGSWDKRILKLCDKINENENYYTTSSCSGRIVLMISQNKKAPNLFLKIYHDKISFQQLKKDLIETSRKGKKLIKLKMEVCALNVACRDLESVKKLFAVARSSGWKRAGIMISDKRIMLSLNSTEKLEFPVISDGKILVSDNFLKIVVKESGEKLQKGWEKIQKLERFL